MQYSLLSRQPETSGLIEACGDLGVAFIAYSPICLGLLSGTYSESRLPKGPRGVLFKQLLPKLDPLLSLQREIAAARGKSCSQVAVTWCMARGALPIPGVRTAAQAADAVGCLSFRLTPEETAALDRASAGLPSTLQNIFMTA